MQPAIDDFVRAKCQGIRHTGRGFYSHLRGTYEILKDAGAPDYVCLAGFCHSIYGTNVFRIAAVPITTRHEVAQLIGEPAERLAHIFCSANRPMAWIKAARHGPPYRIENRITCEPIELTALDLHDLLMIESANLREQRSLQALPEISRALRAMKERVYAA